VLVRNEKQFAVSGVKEPSSPADHYATLYLGDQSNRSDNFIQTQCNVLQLQPTTHQRAEPNLVALQIIVKGRFAKLSSSASKWLVHRDFLELNAPHDFLRRYK
jgi:hypothetical protein